MFALSAFIIVAVFLDLRKFSDWHNFIVIARIYGQSCYKSELSPNINLNVKECERFSAMESIIKRWQKENLLTEPFCLSLKFGV